MITMSHLWQKNTETAFTRTQTQYISRHHPGIQTIRVGNLLIGNISGIFPYKKGDKYMLYTNYYNECLHLIDLNKAKEMKSFCVSSSIVDLVFLNDNIVSIDCQGKMGIFKIDVNNEFTVIESMSFAAKLRNTPICMDITVDDCYVVVISYNEFVIYSISDFELSRIASKTERNVHWDGMLIFDRYFDYKMLPDFNDEREDNEYKMNHPFFVFLWEHNAQNVKLYLVSGETSILVPIIELIVFDDQDNAIKWNVMSNDDEYIYIATFNGTLISFCIQRLREIIMDSYKSLVENNFNYYDIKIGKIRGNIHSANIENSFNLKKSNSFNDDDDIMCSCLNITSYGVLLCLGYRSGMVYIYNITESAPLLEIHTKNECVSSLLLFNDILFIGYCDGVIQIFNIYNNLCLFNKQCHYGAVHTLYHAERDYYVFSLGKDNAVCSYLVYSEILTMKGIMDEIKQRDDDDDDVKWSYYRGHSTHRITHLYRNEWCLENDYIVIETDNGDIFVWSVATAQMERYLNQNDAKQFKSCQSFNIENRRNDIIINNELYNIHSLNTLDLNANIVILDIISIFKTKKYKIDDIIRVLSLLLDWDIMTETFNNSFYDNFNDFLLNINYQNTNNKMIKIKNESDLYNLSLIKHIKPCFGFIGDYNSMTMLFPISSKHGGKWKMCSKFTSIYMLSISMLCVYLRKQIQSLSDDQQNDDDNNQTMTHFVTTELITFYSVLLPSNLSDFVEPSRSVVSRCCLSSTSSLRKTARLLLENMVKRMTQNAKKHMISKWKDNMQKLKDDEDEKILREYVVFRRLTSRSRSRSKLNTNNTKENENENENVDKNHTSLSTLFNAIFICIISETIDDDTEIDIDDTVTLSVINNLTAILNEMVHHKSDVIKKSLCCYYLGRVITSWFKTTFSSLFITLLNTLLDLCTDYDDAKSKNGNILSESAMYALIECGVAEPQLFIQTMGTEALQISKRFRHCKALQCMQRLIYTAPLSLIKHLPFMVKTIIKCLDPSSPQKRKSLLKATTSTLHALVHKFPNCSFHAKTQHFALSSTSTQNNGTYNNNDIDHNCIIIYDLRTATRFGKGLEHDSPITAIQFNNDGKYLISYSPQQQPPVLYIWKLNANDGILGLFSSQSKCIKIVQLPILNTKHSDIEHLNNTQIIWDQQNKQKVTLQREDKSVVRFEIS